MNFDYNDKYFFKLVDWIMKETPGTYTIESFTKEPEKFKKHIAWYNQCRPKDFNSVVFISETEFEVVNNKI